MFLLSIPYSNAVSNIRTANTIGEIVSKGKPAKAGQLSCSAATTRLGQRRHFSREAKPKWLLDLPRQPSFPCRIVPKNFRQRADQYKEC